MVSLRYTEGWEHEGKTAAGLALKREINHPRKPIHLESRNTELEQQENNVQNQNLSTNKKKKKRGGKGYMAKQLKINENNQ